jgi:hypothetical protein
MKGKEEESDKIVAKTHTHFCYPQKANSLSVVTPPAVVDIIMTYGRGLRADEVATKRGKGYTDSDDARHSHYCLSGGLLISKGSRK